MNSWLTPSGSVARASLSMVLSMVNNPSSPVVIPIWDKNEKDPVTPVTSPVRILRNRFSMLRTAEFPNSKPVSRLSVSNEVLSSMNSIRALKSSTKLSIFSVISVVSVEILMLPVPIDSRVRVTPAMMSSMVLLDLVMGMPSRVNMAFCAVSVVAKVSETPEPSTSCTATVLAAPVSVPEMTRRRADPSFKIVASTAIPALLIAWRTPSRVSLVASMVIMVVTPPMVTSSVPGVMLVVRAANPLSETTLPACASWVTSRRNIPGEAEEVVARLTTSPVPAVRVKPPWLTKNSSRVLSASELV